MTDIIVERHWEPPITAADIQTMLETTGGCLATHRCDWHGSLLSADGANLFCHFTAPDAESVRLALHESGSPRGSVWPGTVHDAPDFTDEALAQANVLVGRRFDEPAVLTEVQAIEDAGAGCLQTHRVRFVRTYFSRDRRRMMCLYLAPDAESVRIAQREAGMPVESVWAIHQFRP
jgi:Nickel responsive protein SCO4226-like